MISPRAEKTRSSDPLIMEDVDGTTIATFNATIETTSMSFDPKDLLKLDGASSREFLNPVLKGCELLDFSFSYVGSFGAQIVMFGGRDAVGSNACQKFMKSVANGFQIRFNDVPLANHPDKIKTVLINVHEY